MNVKPELSKFIISPQATLQQAIVRLNMNASGIALVVDQDQRLLGTITDGDIRRAILAGINVEAPIDILLKRKLSSSYPKPITARAGTNWSDLLSLMQENVVRQIPLIDDGGRVTDLVTWEQLVPRDDLPLKAVILAGGRSTRLHPDSVDLPQSMQPVGKRPLLELTLAQLRRAGVRQVSLTTHYKPESITGHFGDGLRYGMRIQYLSGEQPLGCDGSLGSMPSGPEPVLVINGEVLTRLDYRAMLEYHNRQKADMTVAVRQQEFHIPYGVVEVEDGLVSGLAEKAEFKRFIDAGIYLLSPDLVASVQAGQPFDIPELVNRLVAGGKRVVSFPIHEYWLDIKEYSDYQQAQADAQKGLFQDLEQATLQFEPGTPAPPGFIPLCVPEIRGNEWIYIKECLDANWVSSVGPFVDRFEAMVAGYVGARHGVAAGSGTAALHTALLVAGVQPDDEVLVSSLTFIAPANAVRYTGAWPVFMDAEADYWQMDPQRVVDFLDRGCRYSQGVLYNRATGRRVKAVMPVHILGHPCDMDPILAAARKYGLVVIEDATESLGAKYKGRMVGALGDIACFSFNGNKIITTGGGGMLVTDNEAWAAKAKYLTTQAKDDPLEYIHNEMGYNYRLTNIQSAMGCAQMEKLDDYIAVKRGIAARYSRAFSGLDGLAFNKQASWAESNAWLYTILVDEAFGIDSRALLHKLAGQGIQARPLWQPLHNSPSFRSLPPVDAPVAERLNRQALSLPCSVGITPAEVQKVIDAICA